MQAARSIEELSTRARCCVPCARPRMQPTLHTVLNFTSCLQLHLYLQVGDGATETIGPIGDTKVFSCAAAAGTESVFVLPWSLLFICRSRAGWVQLSPERPSNLPEVSYFGYRHPRVVQGGNCSETLRQDSYSSVFPGLLQHAACPLQSA